MLQKTSLFLVLIIALGKQSVQSEKAECVVKTLNGYIRGRCNDASISYDAYTRIPFAQPPLGALRFEAPQPVESWEGIRDATADPIKSVQFNEDLGNVIEGFEDSLYLNVFVPHKVDAGIKPMVMIYIYPGAFQFGDPTNDREFFMSQGNAILVTFAYRTGPLGFLSTFDEQLPGNMGLKDQRMVIEWVERNIEAFGGDSKKILLFGDSAGGASAEYHMLAGKTNIKAFASLSGSVLNPWAFDKNPLKKAKEFGIILNCTLGENFKECLQQKSLSEIHQAYLSMLRFLAFDAALFRPSVEPAKTVNAFLLKEPLQLLRSKQGKKDVNYLVGIVEGEGAWNAASFLRFMPDGSLAIEALNTR